MFKISNGHLRFWSRITTYGEKRPALLKMLKEGVSDGGGS